MRLTVIRHEMIVGWFIVFALIVGVVGVVLRTQSKGLIQTQELHFVAKHGKGLQPGAPVLLQGIQVGEVGTIQLTALNTVQVTLLVAKRFTSNIRRDAEATIEAPPVLGSAKVIVSPGRTKEPAAPGQWLASEESGSFFDQFGDIRAQVEGVVAKVDTFVVTGTRTLEEVRVLLARINAGEGTVGQLVTSPDLANDLRQSVASITSASTRLQGEGIDRILETVTEAEGLLEDLRAEDGELRTLLRDLDTTVNTTRETLERAQLAQTTESFREVAGALSEAATNIGSTAKRLNISAELRESLDAIRKASDAIDALARQLERQPSAVIFGRTPTAAPGVRR